MLVQVVTLFWIELNSCAEVPSHTSRLQRLSHVRFFKPFHSVFRLFIKNRAMKVFLCSASIWLIVALAAGLGADCQQISNEMDLPADLKTTGKIKAARWQTADKVLNELSERVRDLNCSFTFEEIFKVSNPDETYFPITNTTLRIVPEESLAGLTVFRKDGEAIGTFDSRVAYQRSGGLYATDSYTLYYFQFKDQQGKFQSSGNRLLLDDYLIRWSEVADRIAVDSRDQ
ncbi:MAG TPA: hypothetical protein VKZ59_12925 [Acidobacteriota bacterium]|nr:hypothetical protein [Acidobacteriota bacterium]